jgi:hypothetical protein
MIELCTQYLCKLNNTSRPYDEPISEDLFDPFTEDDEYSFI